MEPHGQDTQQPASLSGDATPDNSAQGSPAVDNRRAGTRHEVCLDATITVGGERYDTEISNVSIGGALIALAAPLPVGTPLRISFRVPTLEVPITVDARVRWSSRDGAGVSFDGLRAREVWSLNKYFDSLS